MVANVKPKTEENQALNNAIFAHADFENAEFEHYERQAQVETNELRDIALMQKLDHAKDVQSETRKTDLSFWSIFRWFHNEETASFIRLQFPNKAELDHNNYVVAKVRTLQLFKNGQKPIGREYGTMSIKLGRGEQLIPDSAGTRDLIDGDLAVQKILGNHIKKAYKMIVRNRLAWDESRDYRKNWRTNRDHSAIIRQWMDAQEQLVTEHYDSIELPDTMPTMEA